MKCSECLGKGFIEYEAGQIMVKCEECNGTGEIDEPTRRIDPDDSGIGSKTTSESPKPRKRKTRKKATKRAG